MQYYQGNLALNPKKPDRKPDQKPAQQQAVRTQQQAARVPTIPVKTKLMRLATVVFIVCVLVFIMGRYTQIYQYNLDIRNMNKEIAEVQADNSSLKQQAETLKSPERLKAKAEEYGFVPPLQESTMQAANTGKATNGKETGTGKAAGNKDAGQKTGTNSAKTSGQAVAAKR